jgi:hypothetical protein
MDDGSEPGPLLPQAVSTNSAKTTGRKRRESRLPSSSRHLS